MAAPNKYVVLAAFSILALGIYDLLTNYDDNACEMTWMFEYPVYQKINLLKSVEKKFGSYNLYVYGEGGLAERNKALNFNGIPVLFIPGNAGSYRQVRSLGSVALRMVQDSGRDFSFNYFSADFNEELSGIYGGVLDRQVAFIHTCIKHILRLYKKKNNVKSMIIVGHSMGGMVARALYTRANFDPSLVHTIITQATPHQTPVVSIDSAISNFYKKVNKYWKDHMNDTLADVTIVSTSGGYRDIQVRNSITKLSGLVSKDRQVSTSTMSVPHAWVSTDHLCSVWCRQMVLVTVRAMIDIVNKETKQVENNPHYKMQVFRHHFLHHPGNQDYQKRWIHSMELDKTAKWELKDERKWRIVRNKVSSLSYILVPLPQDEEWEMVVHSTAMSDVWIVGCHVNGSERQSCDAGENLSQLGTAIPPLYSNKKVIHLTADVVQSFTHVVIVVPKSNSQQVDIGLQIHNTTSHYIDYQVPGLLSLLQTFPTGILQTQRVLETTEKALYYKINLIGLESVRQAYTVSVDMMYCHSKLDGVNSTVLKLIVPWSNENIYKAFMAANDATIGLKLQSAKPTDFNDSPSLHMYLHPSCSYRLTVGISYKELMGQFVRFYGTFLPGFLIANVLMVLIWQLKQIRPTRDEGHCPPFLDSYAAFSQGWRVAPLAAILSRVFMLAQVVSLFERWGLPLDDQSILLSSDISWHTLMSPVLFLIAGSLLVVFSILLSFILKIISVIIGWPYQKCCSSKYLDYTMYHIGSVVLIAAVYASYNNCGTVGLLACFIVQLVKAIHFKIKVQYGDGLEQKRAQAKYNVQFTMLLLHMMLFILNAPPLIVWVKSSMFSKSLIHDPSCLVGVAATLACVGFHLLQFEIRSKYKISPTVIFLVVVYMMMYCIESVYRISYCLTAVLGVILIDLVMDRFITSKVQEKEKTS